MALRSAHKAPEKPPARLRLSLTHSLDPEGEDEDPSYRACRRSLHPRLPRRTNKPMRSPFGRLPSSPSHPASPTQDLTHQDWEGREEEDEEDMEEEAEEGEEEEEARQQSEREGEMCSGILNGERFRRSGGCGTFPRHDFFKKRTTTMHLER